MGPVHRLFFSFHGDVDIANGVLGDRHLQVQGSGATARISTRTNLGKATTDTTISFTLTEDPSAPYLIMTARGPLAGPSFSATRGSAKDPPGMVNILSNIQKVPSLLPSISIPTPTFQTHLAGRQPSIQQGIRSVRAQRQR